MPAKKPVAFRMAEQTLADLHEIAEGKTKTQILAELIGTARKQQIDAKNKALQQESSVIHIEVEQKRLVLEFSFVPTNHFWAMQKAQFFEVKNP